MAQETGSEGSVVKLDWIYSEGGPLVCGGVAAVAAWQGANGSSVGMADTDYERACDTVDYLSMLPSGAGVILVLGDEPMQSSFAATGNCLCVVRWIACTSQEQAISAIARLPATLDELEAPLDFRLDEYELVMFDAAASGTATVTKASSPLPPGSYRVTTESYKEKGRFEFVVHRFLRS